jgi:hypothetical protein
MTIQCYRTRYWTTCASIPHKTAVLSEESLVTRAPLPHSGALRQLSIIVKVKLKFLEIVDIPSTANIGVQDLGMKYIASRYSLLQSSQGFCLSPFDLTVIPNLPWVPHCSDLPTLIFHSNCMTFFSKQSVHSICWFPTKAMFVTLQDKRPARKKLTVLLYVSRLYLNHRSLHSSSSAKENFQCTTGSFDWQECRDLLCVLPLRVIPSRLKKNTKIINLSKCIWHIRILL